MTRAPLATAQRIALASASTGIDRCGPTTFATSSSAAGASPAMPTPSFVCAAIRPATNVPWPWVSTVAGPATKLFEAAIRPRSSGWVPSIPESITATLTAASGGSSIHASNDRFCVAYHCRGRSGSFGTNDSSAPQPLHVPRACHAPQRRHLATATVRAGIGARSTIRVAPCARSSCTTAARSAVGAIPTANRCRLGGGREAEAERNGSDRDRCPRDHFGCPGGTVTVSAGPTWPSAVSRYVAVLWDGQ